MKSPAEIAVKFRRQWNNANKRESRLLGGVDAWPVCESIGLPKPRVLASDLDSVRRHVDQWRMVQTGEVIWQQVSYRATAEPVSVPALWQLNKPSQWITACADKTISTEFDRMVTLAESTDPMYHSLLIRRRSLWRDKPLSEVIQACKLATALELGCANGKPLRTLSLEGIDTKFFERNGALVTRLLDVRFDGEVSRIGLEVFLDALSDGDHWLLLVDLDGQLLPFKKQRIASAELATASLPGQRLLIVENESCQHQLPELRDTIAILGAGFDLGWAVNPCLSTKQIAYWGDIDTWGLHCLSRARAHLPHLCPLLMTEALFNQHNEAAVSEPVVAGTDVPANLQECEAELYRKLLSSDRGRLEQEFLAGDLVLQHIRCWLNQLG